MDPKKLSSEEQKSLERLEERYRDVREFTRVTDGVFNTGLVIWGPTGVGKSWQVEQALKKAGRPYDTLNSRLTGPGLFKRTKSNAGGTFLAEDLEEMASRDRRCVDLLRPMLWGQEDENGVMRRTVAYTTARESDEDSFDFTGALIMTMNSRPEVLLPEVAALEARIVIYHLNPGRYEIFALAHQLALKGYSMKVKGAEVSLSPEETNEMWQRWRETLPATRTPDLRFLVKAYRLRLGFKHQKIQKAWEEVMDSLLHQGVGKVETPAKAVARREAVAAELRRKHGDDLGAILPEWTKATDLTSKQSYYNALERYDQRR